MSKTGWPPPVSAEMLKRQRAWAELLRGPMPTSAWRAWADEQSRAFEAENHRVGEDKP